MASANSSTIGTSDEVETLGGRTLAYVIAFVLSATPAAFGPWLVSIAVGVVGYNMPDIALSLVALAMLVLTLTTVLPAEPRDSLALEDVLVGLTSIGLLAVWAIWPNRMEALQLNACIAVLLAVWLLVVLAAESRWRPRRRVPVMTSCARAGDRVRELVDALASQHHEVADMKSSYRLIIACVAATYLTMYFVVWYSVTETAKVMASARRWPGVLQFLFSLGRMVRKRYGGPS